MNETNQYVASKTKELVVWRHVDTKIGLPFVIEVGAKSQVTTVFGGRVVSREDRKDTWCRKVVRNDESRDELGGEKLFNGGNPYRRRVIDVTVAERREEGKLIRRSVDLKGQRP